MLPLLKGLVSRPWGEMTAMTMRSNWKVRSELPLS